jgi:hypothetical protein
MAFWRERQPFSSLNAAAVSFGKEADSTGKLCESVRCLAIMGRGVI